MAVLQKKHVQQEEVRLTPELAQSYLDSWGGNRPISKANVKKLATAMRRKEWKLNGETIIFDDEGQMIDGQHRCLACIESGVSIPVLVVRGVKHDVYSTLDIGKKRTAGDTLAVMGVENAAVMAAAVRLILMMSESSPNFHEQYSNEQVKEWVEAMGEDLQAFMPIANGVYRTQLCTKSMVVGLSYFMAQKDYKLLHTFWERVADGAGLNKGHPILALRKRLFDNRMGKMRLTQKEMVALIVKAWNKTRKNEMLNPRAGLQWREDENFPKVQ